MKRNLLIAAIALLAVAFVSCQKDGVYKPKKKIAKITCNWEEIKSTSNGSDTTKVNDFVSEEFIWGKKTIEKRIHSFRKFNYVTNTESFPTIEYTYSYDDKNRLIGMREDNFNFEYIYNDDKRLSNINVYDGTDTASTVELGYEDKHVSSMKITEYYYSNKSQAALAMILPSHMISVIYPEEITCGEIVPKDASTEVTDVTFEWDGKNISRMTSKNDKVTSTATYEYDGKINPFSGFYSDENLSSVMFSKNNVTKITSTRTIVVSSLTTKEETTEDIVYEYDGNVPTSAKTTSVTNTEMTGLVTAKQTTTKVTNEKYEYTK